MFLRGIAPLAPPVLVSFATALLLVPAGLVEEVSMVKAVMESPALEVAVVALAITAVAEAATVAAAVFKPNSIDAAGSVVVNK